MPVDVILDLKRESTEAVSINPPLLVTRAAEVATKGIVSASAGIRCG